ncbi:MAG: 2-oxo acid dehydrogenase subunit E2 [Chloroflexi bacterium]|nr:2-oxo acid dehydrogenase subunit E2 [Chloroflexota bacterium]
MISEVVMPQMGADMEEGTIIKWLKSEGDTVERGEIIAEIETDKANVEIEAFDGGVFRKTLASEGDTIDVGTIIAIIAAADDDISAYDNGAAATAAKPEAAAPPDQEKEPTPKAAGEEPVQPRTEAAPVSSDGRVRASPVARRLAQEHNVDLTTITGTGPDGRIVKRDVEAAMAGGPPRKAVPAAPAGTTTTIEMSKMRQTIARRMAQSKREAPHYYITVDIDMTEAERLRRQLNDAVEDYPRVSVNDLIVRASAISLARHPMFNSWFIDEQVQQHSDINVCIAIALDEGLIAPAILDTASKTLGEIGNASRDLAGRAKSGALKPAEYTGGTFTVSNLGMFGVEALIAIIQPPQTAILGIGGVRTVPVVRDGRIETAELMKTALSADHRVTDGAQGAQFLNEIRRLLESPASLLV